MPFSLSKLAYGTIAFRPALLENSNRKRHWRNDRIVKSADLILVFNDNNDNDNDNDNGNGNDNDNGNGNGNDNDNNSHLCEFRFTHLCSR